jgi:DNA-binding NtrC family response regulator
LSSAGDGGGVVNDSNRKGRILVVDDDEQVADLVSDYLIRAGYNTAVAYGGTDGLNRFRDGDFQMVLTDMKMPEMDGVELLEAVKAIKNDVIVIIITAYSTIDAAADAIKLGAFDFISKPFELESLKEIVDRGFEQRRPSKLSRIFQRS